MRSGATSRGRDGSRTSTTAISRASEPSETQSRRPSGRSEMWRAGPPTPTRATTCPRTTSSTATSCALRVRDERVPARGRSSGVARFLEAAEDAPDPESRAVQDRDGSLLRVCDQRRAAHALDAARAGRRRDPATTPPAELDGDDVRLEVGRHERDRRPAEPRLRCRQARRRRRTHTVHAGNTAADHGGPRTTPSTGVVGATDLGGTDDPSRSLLACRPSCRLRQRRRCVRRRAAVPERPQRRSSRLRPHLGLRPPTAALPSPSSTATFAALQPRRGADEDVSAPAAAGS